MNGGVLVRMQKLNRVFNGDDVVILKLVHQVDDGRQSRTLATAGGTRNQHYPVFDLGNFFQLFREVEVAEIGRARWDDTLHDSVSAPLLEDVYAKTAFARSAKGEVSRTALFQTFNSRLLIGNDEPGN